MKKKIEGAPQLSRDQFFTWMASAKAGDHLEYYRGFLALDLERLRPKGKDAPENLEYTRIKKLADAARYAEESGRCHLFQARLNKYIFSYRAMVSSPKTRAVDAAEIVGIVAGGRRVQA